MKFPVGMVYFSGANCEFQGGYIHGACFCFGYLVFLGESLATHKRARFLNRGILEGIEKPGEKSHNLRPVGFPVPSPTPEMA